MQENNNEKEEKIEEIKIDLKDKIKFVSCNCAVTKVKTDDAVYAAGVLIMKAKYKDVLKCKSTLLNQNDVKIDTNFSVTWNMQTKTGAPIESITSKAGEYLPPNVKVSWETDKDYLFESDKLQDVKKRLSKTICEISDVKAVK